MYSLHRRIFPARRSLSIRNLARKTNFFLRTPDFQVFFQDNQTSSHKMAKKILIIDDSESIREVNCSGLELSGYNAVKGVNGNDGLRQLGENCDVELVITDLNMPVMDGISFLKE